MALEEVEVATGLSKIALTAIAIMVAIAVIGGWIWWNSHMNAKNAAAVPKAAAIENKAEANAGKAAVNTVQDNQTKAAKIDEITRNNTYVTNNHPAAKTEIDPTFIAAFNRAICMYDSAASLPECQQLQQHNP